jgi:type VI secretion system protein ImpA
MSRDALLLPLPGIQGAGEDLSFGPEFDAIVEARRADDPTLPLGDWKERGKEAKVADWGDVADRCAELLATRTKDLRLVGWLTEAWGRMDGAAGLERGLRLQAGLVEGWWEAVHPRLDDGDAEERIGALNWLLKQVIERCGTWLLHDDAPASTRIDARAALEALRSLQRAVDARLGDEGPSFARAREVLEEIMHALPAEPPAAPLPDRSGPAWPGAPQVAAAGPISAVAGSDSLAAGPPQTRAQALQQLRQVAEFFRRTEPHSPVAYLADKAARWGSTDLHHWLRQVVRDDATLARLEDLLGVEPPVSGG